MPAVPSSLLEPIWVEFAVAIGTDERPEFDPSHPLGCHRRRIPDRAAFEHLLDALVTAPATSGSPPPPARTAPSEVGRQDPEVSDEYGLSTINFGWPGRENGTARRCRFLMPMLRASEAMPCRFVTPTAHHGQPCRRDRTHRTAAGGVAAPAVAEPPTAPAGRADPGEPCHEGESDSERAELFVMCLTAPASSPARRPRFAWLAFSMSPASLVRVHTTTSGRSLGGALPLG
jgi:hypothetical protein